MWWGHRITLLFQTSRAPALMVLTDLVKDHAYSPKLIGEDHRTIDTMTSSK